MTGKIFYTPAEQRQMNWAMRLSLAVSFLMLGIKGYAYFLTGSSAILSDSAESVVHILAVAFAVYSMWLSHKPADLDHTYGHDRITFFSAGFEGALIIVAAGFIFFQAVQKMKHGFFLENIDAGMTFILAATIFNGVLGVFLLGKGKKFHSLVLEANGKHILTDCMTSLGVILALILCRLTGWIYFDPLLALVIALNILWTGVKLIYSAFHGLMDRTDSALDRHIRQHLEVLAQKYEVTYHHLRHRNAGNRLLIEVHLLFPDHFSILHAHEVATCIEHEVASNFDRPVEFVSHLEPLEGHDEIHVRLLGRLG